MKWVLIIIFVLSVGIFTYTANAPAPKETTIISNSGEENASAEEVFATTEVRPYDTYSEMVLDLSNQGLTQTPAYVFEQRKLTHLNLSNNSLTGALQAEVRNLSNLKVLDLSNNQFTGVPAEVGQLSNLEELNLSNNQLTGLPHELGNLNNLNTLDLRGNNPSKFDLEIIRSSLTGTEILID